MKYLEAVFSICNCAEDLKNLSELPIDEREGAYGVAMMIAFLENCRPSLDEFAKHLELTDEEVRAFEAPYRRLQVSGLFSMRFNARRDRGLQGWGTAHEGRTAWCHVAGVASGIVGAGYYIKESPKPVAPVAK